MQNLTESIVTQSIVTRSIVNLAAYRFAPLRDPAAWVAPLQARCEALALKGTIIVAAEGINLFVAGTDDATASFMAWLATEPRFVDVAGRAAVADLPARRSRSAERPFARMRVRHKPEIVTMRTPTVEPGRARAPVVSPRRLAEWLVDGRDDDRRPVTLLDTRNAFEFEHGSFAGARHLAIDRFEAFPDAVPALLDGLRDETIVTFCTGGIRCEKAALYMREVGFTRVLQLDGGILGYFDEVGDAHWRGNCFVFDERVALGPDLTAAGGDTTG